MLSSLFLNAPQPGFEPGLSINVSWFKVRRVSSYTIGEYGDIDFSTPDLASSAPSKGIRTPAFPLSNKDSNLE